MAVLNYVESERKVEEAIYYKKLMAGNGWLYTLEPGQVFRIVDLEGNQAADTLFFDADQPTDHYSAVNTIQCQQNIYLSTGSVLIA